jgi:hypothetical protein
MATHVYYIASGERYRWNLGDKDPVTPPDLFAPQCMGIVCALVPLDDTQVRDPVSEDRHRGIGAIHS